MTKKLCFTFDLDDTLIPTQEQLYDVSKIELSNYIVQLTSGTITGEEVLEKFAMIDLANISEFGFSRKRYPTSWVQTLIHFVGEHHPNAEEEKSKVFKLANWIFEECLQPYASVTSMLEEAKKIGDSMNILTAGDEEIQAKRIQDSGLLHFFDKAVIVPVKTPDVMKTYLADKEEYVHVMIGNSLRSDIYPALECGMFAIHIEQGGWSYDQFEVDTEHGNYFKSTLEGLPEILKKIKCQIN